MSIYMVCNWDGTMICDGLQDHEARKVAQWWANQKQESVWLSEHGSDYREEFEPNRKPNR